MKKTLFYLLVLMVITGFISCATGYSQRVILDFGNYIAWLTIESFSQKNIDFKFGFYSGPFYNEYNYYDRHYNYNGDWFFWRIIDSEERIVSERWVFYRIDNNRRVRMEAKEGFEFKPGAEYVLKIGKYDGGHQRYYWWWRCYFMLPDKNQ